MSKEEKIQDTRYVGSRGLLTKEEMEAIRQGTARCTQDHIPALGIRATSYIRSYEIAPLVRWSIKTDAKMNDYVSCALFWDKG